MKDRTWRKKKILDLLKALYFPVISITMALVGGGLIIWSLGFDPFSAYAYLVKGSFGDVNAISETLVKACPVIFTGLSYAIARRCGLINLGAEGQLYMGALAATLVGTSFQGLPMAVHLPLTLIAGFIGGAVWGMIVGVLRVKMGASELITTIMFNYIAIHFISYCVTGPIKDISGTFPQSRQIFASAQLPRLLAGTRLHAGVVVAILGIIFYYFFMWKTTKGYEMRVIGFNPTAGEYAGMNLKSNSVMAMLIAGGFAGLGGCIEIIGMQMRLMQNFSTGYGFDGIAVALLGSNSPIGIALSGILFGALRSGSGKMEMLAKVPSAVIYMIQALIILFVVGRALFNFSKKKHIPSDGRHKGANYKKKKEMAA
jgi:ABC-type uncharacterized transport system permease subunit